MLIILGFYRRRPGLTREEFFTHWEHVHGPLIRSNSDMTRHIRRYVQHRLSPGLESPLATTDFPYDGFSEVWVDDMAAVEQIGALPWIEEVLIPDERRFIDMETKRVALIDNQSYQIGPKPLLAR